MPEYEFRPEIAKTQVKESAGSARKGRPVLFVNPGHGNEPYILASKLGVEVSNRFLEAGLEAPVVVTPLLYGDRQKRILLEENPQHADLIHLDEESGKILTDIMFGAGDFKTHLSRVNTHYDDVEKLLNQRFGINGETITTRNLATGDSVEMSPKNIIGAIDVGNRVSLSTPHRYYAFPELLSRVLHECIEHPELGFSEADMKKLANKMLKVEAAYSKVFVPWISTFSYQHAEDLDQQPDVIDGRTRTYTPAMKVDIPKTQNLDDEAVYVMFSGTGSAVDSNRSLVEAAHQAGIKAYSPPWEKIEGAEQLPPSVLADQNMLAVLGRSGWGTGWQAMQLELPWLVAPYQQSDDPEIFFNNKTIEALNLGRIIGSEGISGTELRSMATEISPGLRSLNARVKDKFGTTDGIDYIADHIFADLTNTPDKK